MIAWLLKLSRYFGDMEASGSFGQSRRVVLGLRRKGPPVVIQSLELSALMIVLNNSHDTSNDLEFTGSIDLTVTRTLFNSQYLGKLSTVRFK